MWIIPSGDFSPFYGFPDPSLLELQLSVELSGSTGWHWLGTLLFLGVAKRRLSHCPNTPFLQLFPRQLTFKGAALAADCLTLTSTLFALKKLFALAFAYLSSCHFAKWLPRHGGTEQKRHANILILATEQYKEMASFWVFFEKMFQNESRFESWFMLKVENLPNLGKQMSCIAKISWQHISCVGVAINSLD